MKLARIFDVLIGLMFVLPISVCAVESEETKAEPILWNSKAKSKILNQQELAKLKPIIVDEQIRRMVWPSVEEVNSTSVEVDRQIKASCLGWLKKFMAKEYLPADLEKNLVAMKSWRLPGKKKPYDIFIVRFQKGDYTIQIQEYPHDVVITVADERLAQKPRTDHKDWVLEMAAQVLNYEVLKPNPDLEDVHVSEKVENGHKKTRVTWAIDTVTVRKGKRRLVNGREAAEIGTDNILCETEGRFIYLYILKSTAGPKAMFDPYTQRFGPRDKPSDSQEQKEGSRSP